MAYFTITTKGLEMSKYFPKKTVMIHYRLDQFIADYRKSFIERLSKKLGYKVSASQIERLSWIIIQISPRREKRVIKLAEIFLKKIG